MSAEEVERELAEKLKSLPVDCQERVLEHRGKLPLQALLELAECLGAKPRPERRRTWWLW